MFYEKNADSANYYLISKREYRNNEKTFYTHSHYHDSVELFLIYEGVMDATVNGVNYKVSKGDIIFCNTSDIHSYSSNKCKGYALVFTKKFCRTIFEDGLSLENFITPNDNVFNNILNKIQEVYELQLKNELNPYLIESLILYIVGELLSFAKNDVKKVDKNRETMLKVLDYIDDNYFEEITLPSLAKRFGYATNYFSMLFNKFTAMSFNDYLNMVRYNKALALLNDNKNAYTVTEIANTCGFGSMNTFYRAKKKFSKS